jgi:V-type H+-transporting ATPase proteolipid subunit
MAVDPELLTGLGAIAAMFLTATGSALASSHAGVFALRSNYEGLWKNFVPIMQAGVLAIYGIIVSVILVGQFKTTMTAVDGYRNLSAGLSVGLTCWASGWGMAKFLKQFNEQSSSPTIQPSQMTEPLVGRRAEAVIPKPINFVHFCFVMIFLEAIGLYGLIVALFLMG